MQRCSGGKSSGSTEDPHCSQKVKRQLREIFLLFPEAGSVCTKPTLNIFYSGVPDVLSIETFMVLSGPMRIKLLIISTASFTRGMRVFVSSFVQPRGHNQLVAFCKIVPDAETDTRKFGRFRHSYVISRMSSTLLFCALKTPGQARSPNHQKIFSKEYLLSNPVS